MPPQQNLHQPTEILETLIASPEADRRYRLELTGQPTVLTPSCNGVSYTTETLGTRQIEGTVTRVINTSDGVTVRFEPTETLLSLPDAFLEITFTRQPEGHFERPTFQIAVDDPTTSLTTHANLPHDVGPVAAVEPLE